MCTCQIQTAVVFLFFLCGSKHQAYKPPSFSQSSCWYRAVMSCSVSTVCIREMPSLSAASFDIYLQCKSVLGSKAIDEWKWKANELWSVSAYLPSCAFKNALRLLLSRTQEKPPEPYSTIRQTLLTRVFVSLSNTDKVLYTIMFACVPLRVLFFFFFPTQLCLYCSVNLLYQSAHFLFLSDFRTFQMADFLAYVSSFPWKLRVLRYILILLMCGLCSNKYYDPVDLNLEHAI